MTGRRRFGRGFEIADDRKLATELADILVSAIKSRDPRPYLRPMEIFTADVEVALSRFRRQYSFLRDHGEPFPCLQLAGDNGKPVPVDLYPTIGFAPQFYQIHPFTELLVEFRHWENLFERLELGQVVELRPVDAADALTFLGVRLVDFLTTRFSARQSNISQGPGIRFAVHTKKNGLRVHYSPAYFFNIMNVFGSPTTPVIGWIQPGRWIFGVQGPKDLSPRIDTAHYDIPPHHEARLVV